MIPIKQQLAEVERELALGHAREPDAQLTALLGRLSRADLADFKERIRRIIGRFQPKRRARLMALLEETEKRAEEPGAPPTSRRRETQAIQGLEELADGRICSWQIGQFEKRVVDRGAAIEVIEEQVALHRRAGDTLGAGEWAVAALSFVDLRNHDPVCAEVLGSWAAPAGSIYHFEHLTQLIEEQASLVETDLAAAVGLLSLRIQELHVDRPQLLDDLAFRLRDAIQALFGFQANRPRELCPRAAAAASRARAALSSAKATFLATTPATGKEASVQLIRRAKALQGMTVVPERPLLAEIPVLVGTEFRKLCEDNQRHRTEGVLRRTPGLRRHATSLLARTDEYGSACLWAEVVRPTARKVLEIADHILASTRQATAPALGLGTDLFKLDLTRVGQETTLTARLVNKGMGRARDVILVESGDGAPVSLRIMEPSSPFDLGGQSAQVVRLAVTVHEELSEATLPIKWTYKTVTGGSGEDQDSLRLLQQIAQPDWERLKSDPPYSHNPVQERDRLFGRDAVLGDLTLNAMARNSCFVWGQKRIGKTSVLQVLARALRADSNVACVFLRMGEIKGLHEGQLAHRIATRFASELGLDDSKAPEEGQFGASMARLIPWMESLMRASPERRLVLIIDEFDDLDPSYYVGERGEQFIKQLRSLSEVGLTFFLVGSERMGAIYRRHENELNKWTNEHLDTISSRVDCRELVIRPLAGSIEFDEASVDEIVEYCAGNPFYMHLLCFSLFQLCMREQKTFIGVTDVRRAKERLMRTSGESNFAHFWSDNPTLSEDEREALEAKCCLLLTLITRAGEEFEKAEDLLDAQRDLGLSAAELLPRGEIDAVTAALSRRRLLERTGEGRFRLGLPILREWLGRQADTVLLPKWRKFCADVESRTDTEADSTTSSEAYSPPAFPISEDDLIAVSQPLTYLSRQVDVAKLRSWLSQFDDEIRVELAFALLCRLNEVGYVSEGAYAQKLQMLIDAVREKRRILGRGSWREVRGRKADLAITYVDGELKSGGHLTRELKARLRPGKSGRMDALGAWLQSNSDQDVLLLVADDFAATGESLRKGLSKLFQSHGDQLEQVAEEGRLLCYLLYALPEAIDLLNSEFPSVDVAVMHCFGDEVRALSPEADIFDGAEERKFAEEMLIQLGRELVPQMPLGFGDLGLLISFYNTIPNNTLPVFWSNGKVAEKAWKPLFPRP